MFPDQGIPQYCGMPHDRRRSESALPYRGTRSTSVGGVRRVRTFFDDHPDSYVDSALCCTTAGDASVTWVSSDDSSKEDNIKYSYRPHLTIVVLQQHGSQTDRTFVLAQHGQGWYNRVITERVF